MKIIKKLYNSTSWSLAGFRYAFKHELAFRLELLVAVIAVPVAIYLATNVNELLWLLLAIAIVLIVELINSAIEATVDRISMEHHKLSKHAKDLGSAAVFGSIILAVLIWALIIFKF